LNSDPSVVQHVASRYTGSINITVEPLFKNYKKKIHLSSIEDSEVVLVSERNDAGLKKLSQVLSEQTSDLSAFLNLM
jgi:hypothetical protein